MSCGRSNLTSFSQSSLKMICFGLGISHPAQCLNPCVLCCDKILDGFFYFFRNCRNQHIRL